MIAYSVLISVYYKEKAENLSQALNSVFRQTVQPDEVVLVCDGPLTPELDRTIAFFQKNYGQMLRILRLEKNMGLGVALHHGVQLCSNAWIARMDSDDISLPDRMEKQLRYIEEHPDIAVLGGQIIEFVDDRDHPVSMRSVPLEMPEIRETFRFRNPMNHVTTMYRKSAVVDVGNYEDYPGFEDYHLWGRLLAKGYAFANLPDCLCHVRVGSEMYRRRSGAVFLRNTVRMQCFLLENKMITFTQFVRNLIIRLSAALMPNSLRGFIFRKVMRKDPIGR